MATHDVKNLDGQTVGKVDLDDAVFGTEVKEHLLWEVIKWQRAKARSGTHSTLRRGEVRGGGKKPYRQKGTGNARQGSTRSPQFVGGGSVFGPKPRDYDYHVPKKVRAGALRSALSLRAKELKLVIIDQMVIETVKTKRMALILTKLGAKSALVVDAKDNTNLALSVRNIPKMKFIATEGVNVYDVIKHETLILSKATALALSARLSESAAAHGDASDEVASGNEGGAK